MCAEITRLCVKAVLSGTDPTGWITDYYRSQKSWEGPMRERFHDLVATRASSGSFGEIADILRKLNADYRTRYPVVHMPAVTECVERAVGDLG